MSRPGWLSPTISAPDTACARHCLRPCRRAATEPRRRSCRVQLVAILREYQLVSPRCFKVSEDTIESAGQAIAGRSSDDVFVYHGCRAIETF